MIENVEKKTVNFLYVPAVTKRQYGKKYAKNVLPMKDSLVKQIMHGNGRQRVTTEPLVMKRLGVKEAGTGRGGVSACQYKC